MDGQILHGRELTVVFAEENRKKPADMRARERVRGRAYDYRRSPRSVRSPPRYARSRSRDLSYDSASPRRRHYSRSPSPRSVSPQDRSHLRGRSYSGSPPYNGSRSRSPEDYSKRSSHRERSVSLSE